MRNWRSCARMALAQRSQWAVAVMIFSDRGYQSDTDHRQAANP